MQAGNFTGMRVPLAFSRDDECYGDCYAKCGHSPSSEKSDGGELACPSDCGLARCLNARLEPATLLPVVSRLLISERDHGIYTHCPSRWHIAGEQRYRNQQHGNGAEGDRIGRADSIDNLLHLPA
jgi:hypothetical protein